MGEFGDPRGELVTSEDLEWLLTEAAAAAAKAAAAAAAAAEFC